MKHFFSLLVCYSITLLSYGQVINYEIDPIFDAGDFYTKGSISNLLIREDGSIIVCGGFSVVTTMAGGWSIVNSFGDVLLNATTQDIGPNIVKPYKSKYITCGPSLYLRNQDASADYSFRFEFQKQAYNGFITNAVNDVLLKDDSLLLVGGIFFTDSTDISPNSLRQLCMIDSTGAPVPGFPMVQCEPIDARIHSIDTLSTGEYIIAGSFSSVNGHPTNNIAKLHSDFSVDTNFSINFLNGGTVFLQLIDSQDRIWGSATSGSFVENPQLPNSLFRIFPDGALDSEMPLPEIQKLYDGFTMQSYANAVFEDADQTYILGGSFNIYNGIPCKGLIKIDNTGGLIEGSFYDIGADEAVWSGWSNYPNISQIISLPEGKLLIGGRFSSFGGQPYNCLVRLKPDGFVGVDEQEGRGKLSIYPNPASEKIEITLPGKIQHLERLRFYDLRGRQVLEMHSPVAGQAVDVSVLPAGMYLIEGQTPDGVFTGKVVVN